jgi:hypothetical protein
MWWDGTANDLRVNSTVSGVDPTQSYHLTTRQYVDDEIATVSGNIITDHGGLTGLEDDDHLQYMPINASRGFTNTVSGVYPTQDYHLTTKAYVDTLSGTGEITTASNLGGGEGLYAQKVLVDLQFKSLVGAGNIGLSSNSTTVTISGNKDHGDLDGLGDDDHTQYILVDGTRAFTGTVGGITPTADNHLTTKQYVDNISQGLSWQEPVIDIVPIASGIAVEGNRYIALTTSGTWTANYIMEYTGTSWSGVEPAEGYAAWVEELDGLYVYNNDYPAGSWVQFGSTTTHNNLSGLQGGTSNEYYHLTSTMYTDLTSAGGVGNASSEHIHDDRYYTESEVNTISGALSSEIDSDIAAHAAISSAHHARYTDEEAQDAVGNIMSGAGSVTVNYNDTANTITVSGIPASEIDHGSLAGLDDDDHTQYVLVDGTRGFTATVSGVDPTQGYHLATKSYVDQGGIDNHGRQAVANGASQVSISFADLGHTNYTINATLENITDSPPSIYAFIVSARASTGFTVTFMGDMDSANYVLDWSIIED